MKQQRVESLVYQLKSQEDILYDSPPPLDVDTEKWEGHLENGILTCRMKAQYGSVADARKDAESYLRDWEISAAIEYGRDSIRFVYQDASIVDSVAQSSGAVVVYASPVVAVVELLPPRVVVTRRNYPPPPIVFRVSPDVEALWRRYQGYLDGKERLLSMAHWCLTMIEASYGQGQRKAAARKMNVDSAVLNTLGRLTSTRGDSTVARKVPKRGESLPLSGTEHTWIQAVVRRLIRRAGEHAACGDSSALPEIGMSDFPSLG